jgi:hypothetical protein
MEKFEEIVMREIGKLVSYLMKVLYITNLCVNVICLRQYLEKR